MLPATACVTARSVGQTSAHPARVEAYPRLSWRTYAGATLFSAARGAVSCCVCQPIVTAYPGGAEPGRRCARTSRYQPAHIGCCWSHGATLLLAGAVAGLAGGPAT